MLHILSRGISVAGNWIVRRDASGKSDRLIRLTVLTIRLTILIDKVAHYLSEYKGIKRRLETMAEKKEKRAVEKGSDIKSSNKKTRREKFPSKPLGESTAC